MKKLEPILSPYINDKTQKYALLKGIYKAYFWEVLFASSLGVFGSVLEFVGPTFILLMDNFLKDDSVPFWKGPALVAYLLIAKIF